VTGLVEGYALLDDAIHLVDAVQAFPALRRASARYAPPSGVAAGYDWHEAVAHGLLGQILDLTMSGLWTATTPFTRIDLAGAALDARGDRLRTLLTAIGEPVTVYDVTGPLVAPTVVCYLGAVAAGCASALSMADAVTDALEQVLLHYQSRVNDQPLYAPPPVRDIPDHLRATTTRPLPDRPPQEIPGLAAALTKRGHRPVAIPLDHDSEVNAIMPYVVHVVIT
jgi:ribosomal protein S12 methylthiotransferase accessory factor YcaO